jgi:hypothetical protein
LHGSFIGATYLGPTPMTTSTKMQAFGAKLTKGKIVAMNSKNVATMANQLSSTSNVHDAFLLGKMNINHDKNNKVKIYNLNMVKDL